MIENVPADSSSSKELALARLRQFREWSEQRDPLVCHAKRAGATYTEIMAASGLAKGTVNSILNRAGLTGDQPARQENAMLATALPTDYQHQPHFVRVEPAPDGDYSIGCRYLNESSVKPPPRVKFTFNPFTGDEPQPVEPALAHEEYTAWRQHGERPLEWALRVAEWHVADDLWRLARYTRTMLPLLEEAAGIWPDYAQACDEVDSLYRDLRTTTQWNQAVLRLLDAHDKALHEAAAWGDVSDHIRAVQETKLHNFPDFDTLAQQRGIDPDARSWKLDRHAYSTMESTIRDQKRQLEEVAKLAGAGETQTGSEASTVEDRGEYRPGP